MSQGEQDQIVGAAKRRLQECRRTASALVLKMERWAINLEQAAGELHRIPGSDASLVIALPETLPSSPELAALIHEYRGVQSEIQRLEGQLSAFD